MSIRAKPPELFRRNRGSLLARLGKAPRSGKRGAAMVEFALIAPILFTVIFSGVLTLWALFRSVLLHYVATTAIREGVIVATLSKQAAPNIEVQNRLNALGTDWGINFAPAIFCPLSSPGCGGQSIPRDIAFVVKVEAIPTTMEKWLGVTLRASAIGINSAPLAMTASEP